MAKVICCFIVLAGILCGCTTAGRPATANELEHQADVARAQAAIQRYADTVKLYDSAITDAITGFEDVRRGATAVSGTIDKLAEQFDEYDRAVLEMVRKLRAVQAQASGEN